MPKNCAFGCPYDSRLVYHRFPDPIKNPTRFQEWVQRVGGKLENDTDIEYFRKKLVCEIHFPDKFKNRNNRLNALAVPSLYLSDFESYISNYLTIISSNQINQQSTSISPSKINQPSTSIEVNPSTTTAPPNDSCSMSMLTRSTVLPSLNETLPAIFTAELIKEEHNYCINENKVSKQTKKTKPLKRAYLVNRNLLRKFKYTREINNVKKQMSRLQKQSKSIKAKLSSVEKISKNIHFSKLTENMTVAAKIFTKMQYTQTQKKPRGRRFSLEEKVLCLSMFKRSPKCYALLARYFTLPSAKSLKRLLAKVDINPGLNKSIFMKMKRAVRDFNPEDRLCSLIFDEMSISPQINYDAAKDQLKGFTHNQKKIADHALVFMVKGLRKNYKQPVAYYFTNALNKTDLKSMVKEVIHYVELTGLKIINTVCDQSTINVSVINDLIEDTRKLYIQEGRQWKYEVIEIGKAKIIPLFDVPHLLKGIRNNLLTKHLKYYDFEEKTEKMIKWEYFQRVYEADKTDGELRLLHKLTDNHLYVEKINKMKVKIAAQVFSHSMAAATNCLVKRKEVPEECAQLITFTKLLDNLFDSLNSNTFHVVKGKTYKSGVRRNSAHHEFWTTAVKVLKTVKYVMVKKCDNNKIRLVETSSVPSIKNLIRTIQGIQEIWKILSHYSFDVMLTRNFNQDPLENFFGNIRSYGTRNTAPSTIAFEGAYKALLLNNYNSPHSLNANCEQDNNKCLQTMDLFLDEKSGSDATNHLFKSLQTSEKEDVLLPHIDDVKITETSPAANYVCGFVLRKSIKNISKNCLICKKHIRNSTSTSNEFIHEKEYKKEGRRYLMYPSQEIEKCFKELQNLVINLLQKNVPKNNLKENIKIFSDIFIEFPFSCELHKNEIKKHFENVTINVIIYSWCRSINRILAGKITYTGEDEIKTAAQMYFNKHNHGRR